MEGTSVFRSDSRAWMTPPKLFRVYVLTDGELGHAVEVDL